MLVLFHFPFNRIGIKEKLKFYYLFFNITFLTSTVLVAGTRNDNKYFRTLIISLVECVSPIIIDTLLTINCGNPIFFFLFQFSSIYKF
jgi:hypothetical protein